MNKALTVGSLVLSLLATTVLMAQETPQLPKSGKEHEWLKQFLGEWESEMEMMMGPGQPPMKAKGTASVKAIGNLWVVAENKCETGPMGPMTAILTLGYSDEKKKYVGTWVDSIMNHLWVFDGTVDATGKALTIETEGPNPMMPGTTSKYKDVYEFKSKDHWVLTSSALGDDGKWFTFGTTNYKRKS